jgi:predicted AAA+ superfamily ATPase
MFPRIVAFPDQRSFFLFGARGTGKSTLIRQRFAAETTFFVDLLASRLEDAYARDPELLYRQALELPAPISTLVIDEIQKVPRLLDSVHRLIFERPELQVVMTGSSARKLRRGSANLLGGRAFERSLHPLCEAELGERFDLDEVLAWGSLPEVFSLAPGDRREYLQTYSWTYLKEEVWGEHLIRQLEPFRRFLEVAAQQAGQPVNFSAIGRDVGVDGKTVREYFQILEDTLVGFILEPYLASTRKRVHKAPKFYFFDLGVSRALALQLHSTPAESTSYYGDLFEQFIILEFLRREAYLRRGYRCFYFQDETCQIDLVVERPGQPVALIEIKSACQIRPQHLRHLTSVASGVPACELFCLYRGELAQKVGEVRVLPWREGLQQI